MQSKKNLNLLGERLGELFTTNHPRFKDVFEDIGAAGYYIQEAGYRLEAAKRTLQDDGEET
ncbi:MAG: hypothetical protein HC874_18045 [Richelia sp. SL_2_1]|nr:hypothetical protein [Richelia sp. SM2_1_7]NJM19142.1 hypothetical protein [Richelia sp. SM1_7_0]NJN12777.1 hypothetical protein [Richelia sp. RM1_1_1]NJO29237.1 hypothetical protein [Richelia sp. SL_2_1]